MKRYEMSEVGDAVVSAVWDNRAVFLIYACEHMGYWKPNRVGYTTDVNEAGRYTYAQAHNIMTAANAAGFVEDFIMLAPEFAKEIAEMFVGDIPEDDTPTAPDMELPPVEAYADDWIPEDDDDA